MRTLAILSLFFLASCERPDLEFTNSKPKHSYMLNDQLIFLNFWADWCAPCIKEFPYFNELDKNPNVTVIGFHFDQFDVLEDEVVEGFIKKFNIQYLNLKFIFPFKRSSKRKKAHCTIQIVQWAFFGFF